MTIRRFDIYMTLSDMDAVTFANLTYTYNIHTYIYIYIHKLYIYIYRDAV